MDNIELTDEMRERVLKNVKASSEAKALSEDRASDSAAKSPISPVPVKKANQTRIMHIIGYAAACLLISTGIFFAWRSSQKGKLEPTSSVISTTLDSSIIAMGTNSSGLSGNPSDPLDFEDISGINQAFGLTLSDISNLPFTPVQKKYIAGSTVAEIVYTDNEDNECIWRISQNASEITAIAENFSTSKTLKTDDGTAFDLYGDDNSFVLATWFDGTNYYSIQFASATPEDTFKAIVQEIQSMV